MWKHLSNKTGRYARLLLRLDRVRLPVWILVLTLISIVVAPAFVELYPTTVDRQLIAVTMENPAMIAMVGPNYGIDNYTIGAIMGHQMLLFTALSVGVMSILLVTRHTRGDEESGRIEMLRSLPVGRLSNLCATLIVMFAGNVVLTLVMGFGLAALGIETMDLAGSLLYGAALGVTGIFFAALTALFAQLSENTKGTMGYSFTFLGVAYIVRAVGDVGNETLARISPLGLILRTQVYVNNYWWPIIIMLAASLGVAVLALYLNSLRDLDAGFIAQKPGRKSASRFLQSPLGLALRLQRTAIIGWLITMFLLGASYGSVLGDMEAFLGSSELIQQMLPPIEGLSMTEQFITMLMAVIAITGSIPPLLMILKLRAEEKKNRIEQLYARAVSRSQMMGSYLFIAAVVGFVGLFLSVAGLWSAAAATMDDPISFGVAFNAAMAYFPAILIMTGIAALLIGFLPQGAGLVWLYLGYSFLVIYLGGILQFADWMSALSPYGFVPQVPVEDINTATVVVMTVAAAALAAAGFFGYRKRDIIG